ncbi:MAG: toluene monooxygenase system protein [Myxococcales bacterium]|jgi:toluene monooxygenase system protein A|nr:toluene monooxygenase system protein [Myxococcales bacterium]
MLKRAQWFDLARQLDWKFSYVDEVDVFPVETAGQPWLPREEWAGWDEPFRTTYTEYVNTQHEKEAALAAVQESAGRREDFAKLPREWLSAVKLHTATLPLAEFAAVVGNLRAARFGRTSAWRTTALFGALDEFRHTQIPLLLMQDLVAQDPQFDWTHRLYHSNNWVAIAARHLVDELLYGASAIEFAVATNFVFETGFTNLQFVGLSALARQVGDRMFEKMLGSIQSDEARHAQIGEPVLRTLVKHDRDYAQYLVDKWFWRSWLLFAVVTGFAMDYLTPLRHRTSSFKDFVKEWVVDQYLRMLEDVGLTRPWYWPMFEEALNNYHHLVYASAYTYRASVWFDLVVPGPDERRWLRQQYPDSWDAIDPIWERIGARWKVTDPDNDFGVHGTAIIGFCNLCQLVLCNGTPHKNGATTLQKDGQKYIFCSEPCRWIFEQEQSRYAGHKDVVKRVLAGEAPANLVAMLRGYFGLSFEDWGKDACGGKYPWATRTR